MSEGWIFVKYIFKEAWREIRDFLKDVVSLKPKTIVYICGTAFVLLWLAGRQRIAVMFLVGFVIALVYKHWVGGEWRHELKRKIAEKGGEQRKVESATPDRSPSSLPQIKR